MQAPKLITRLLIRVLGTLLIVGGLIWTLAPHTASARPAAQAGNLLFNGGFEADDKYEYPRIVTEEGGGAIAAGWTPWWYNDEGPDYAVPEYEVAPIIRDPLRVHSGNAAQQIFRPSILWLAGVYQQVAVPTNASLAFTIWGHSWATFCEQGKNEDGQKVDFCDPRDSNKGGANPTVMKIGIDPTGGTDWQSPNIIWSRDYNIHDAYEQLYVSARARGSIVTVFTYTTFVFPAAVNNVYWDDAALYTTVAPTATPQPIPATPVPTLRPTLTPAPPKPTQAGPTIPGGGAGGSPGVNRTSNVISLPGLIVSFLGAALWAIHHRKELSDHETDSDET